LKKQGKSAILSCNSNERGEVGCAVCEPSRLKRMKIK
jgi:hypothetical protein